MLMLILFYEFILKSKFSTQSCVRCAFLFNVDKSWLYELWWVWTQWWQAWNWFPLCNSSDQINQFALHCWLDLCWSSDCHRHCHHCIGSMFNDLSILTPLFIYDCQSDLSFTLAGTSSLPIIKSLFLCLLCIHHNHLGNMFARIFLSASRRYVEMINIESTGYLSYGAQNKLVHNWIDN